MNTFCREMILDILTKRVRFVELRTAFVTFQKESFSEEMIASEVRYLLRKGMIECRVLNLPAGRDRGPLLCSGSAARNSYEQVTKQLAEQRNIPFEPCKLLRASLLAARIHGQDFRGLGDVSEWTAAARIVDAFNHHISKPMEAVDRWQPKDNLTHCTEAFFVSYKSLTICAPIVKKRKQIAELILRLRRESACYEIW